MNSPYIHERRRLMDTAKKVKFAQLVRESHSLEEAAEWVDVSIRTVQRERRRDEDFDHEVRLAQQASPDPLRLMENAARTHWRAAAWLLERTRPEEYAREPANTARDFQVEAALGMLLEAALAATAPEQRAAFYQQVEPVCGQALQYCFPQLGPGGNLKKSKLPKTPLADESSREALRANIVAFQQQAHAAAANGERVSEWFTVPSPYDELSQLSPKMSDATPSDTTVGWVLAPTSPAEQPTLAPPNVERESKPIKQDASKVGASTHPTHVSPKTSDATPSEPASAVEEPSQAVDYNLPIDFNLQFDDFKDAIGVLDQKEQDIL